ncbi:MAG: DUF362 domain-containing protein [Planctomycetota bacterium]|jgi:uncharacterized Fe-S center protein
MQDNKVYFASVNMKDISAEASLPAKFARMLDGYPLEEMFGKKSTAVKMHVGGNVGYSTIHPFFVRTLVQKLKDVGARPFITDSGWALGTMAARGYTEEVVGAQFVPAAGVQDKYVRVAKVDYRGLEELELAGNVVDADAMVDLSHFKAHGWSAYGGAVKNLGMGAVTWRSRQDLHKLTTQELHWDEEACVHCKQCVEGCPTGAARFDDEDKFEIFFHDCLFCHHCVLACPEDAIAFDDQNIYYFHCGLALATQEVLKRFDPSNVLYINTLLDITSFCDCWGFTTPSLVPDIGIMASRSIMPIDKASLDIIKAEDFIEGSLPGHLKRKEGPGHLFEQIWAKDPYEQIRACEEMGLGSSEYELEEVE